MSKDIASIERVVSATPEIAMGVGELMPDLSSRLLNEPVDLGLLNEIVESPDRDLFIARLNERIVG